MKLTLNRRFKAPEYTIGDLYIEGQWFCNTLEDTDRGLSQNMVLTYIQNKKVKSQTAIPTGTYKVDMDTVSPKYSNYSKYPYAKQFNAKMPRLLNVKGFEGILIHAGNTQKDTDGCILVGINKVKGQVINSQATWKKLMSVLLKDKDNIELTIR